MTAFALVVVWFAGQIVGWTLRGVRDRRRTMERRVDVQTGVLVASRRAHEGGFDKVRGRITSHPEGPRV
jgi:hypothetical protein